MNIPNREPSLRDQYALHIEIGLALALAVLILAFQIDLEADQSFTVAMQEQESVEVTEIQQTRQENEPPPPPKPPVPQEVPNNQVVEQQTPDFDASLDLDERLDTRTTPPPPGDEDEDDEDQPEEEIFVAVEESPNCGGLQALRKKLEYPSLAQKAGIEGRVLVQFVVDEEGNVTNPEVTRGVHELLNKAAVEAVKKLDCTSGKQRGRPVKVQMSMPVVFRLKK